MEKTPRDYDKELEELKKKIKEIVGEDEIKRIMEIVELSYHYDEKKEYKITYNID